MADIFISYAREDRECAQSLAKTLQDEGWTVWWDRDLYGGQLFDMVIEREIADARVVIVVWSSSSVGSVYVRAEAARADSLNKLLPVRIDTAELPLRFNIVHTVDLTPWLAPSKSGGRVRPGSGANEAVKSLLRDLLHYVGARPLVVPEGVGERAVARSPEPTRQVPTTPAPAPLNEFRWDERQHRKSYDTFGIVEDDDWVVIKMPPQLSDEDGETGTVVKKGLVVPKPA